MTAAIIDGLPEREYRALPGLSGTEVAKILASPADLAWERKHRTPSTSAQALGTMVHALVLGQPLSCVVTDYPDFRTKEAREWKAAQEALGLTVVKAEDMERAEAIAAAVRAHPEADSAINAKDTQREVSVTGEHRGAPLKGRIDVLTPQSVIDLKSAKDVSPRAMSRFIWDYGTTTQLAHYALLTGRESQPASIIAVRNQGRPAVAMYQLTEVTWHVALEATKRAWDIYANCMETGVWPDPYATGIHELDLSSWAIEALDPVDEIEV